MQTIDFVAKDEKGDLLQVRLGNPQDIGKLHPELTLRRWEDARLTFRLQGYNATAASVEQGSDWATWRTAGQEIHLFPHGSPENIDGYEWEVVLLSRPMTNKLNFQVAMENLRAEYQPPLTELPRQYNWHTVTETEALDEKGQRVAYRPPEVVGSYALFHASKQGNYANMRKVGWNYRAGKFGHLFRPRAWDQGGKMVWCDLQLSDKTATISIPQAFLDVAVYPVVVDPEFGYHVIGGSNSSWGTAIIGFGPETPLLAGTLTRVDLYLDTGWGNNVQLTVGVHANAAGVPVALLGDSADIGPLADGAGDWFGGPMDVPFPIVPTPYWLSKDHSPAMGLGHFWDNAVGYDAVYKFRVYNPGVLDNPFGALDGIIANTRASIFATYTAGGGGGAPAVIGTPQLGRKTRAYQ